MIPYAQPDIVPFAYFGISDSEIGIGVSSLGH